VTHNNPLLTNFDLPPYSKIKAEHVEPAIDSILKTNRQAINNLLEKMPANLTWENTALVLDETGEKLSRAWGTVSHLNAVMNNPELRAAYEACLPKLSDYWTELGQNKRLFQCYQALKNSPIEKDFSTAQQTILEHTLRDFHLSGIDLPAEKQQRYGEIQTKL